MKFFYRKMSKKTHKHVFTIDSECLMQQGLIQAWDKLGNQWEVKFGRDLHGPSWLVVLAVPLPRCCGAVRS